MAYRLSFGEQVADWVRRVKEAEVEIFRLSARRMVAELNDEINNLIYNTPETPNYRRTGFLRASLVAATDAMPQLTRPNPGVKVEPDYSEVLAVTDSAELGQTIYLGYTAQYAGFVHYGTSRMAPRPWVSLVVQRWNQVVDEVAAEVKARYGL